MTPPDPRALHLRSAVGVLAGVICCLALTACATQVKGRGTSVPVSLPSTAASDSVVPQPSAPAGVWALTTDSVTGIRFALPGKAKLSIQPASGGGRAPGQRRLYDVQVSASLGLSVAIAPSGAGRKYTAKNLDALAPALIAQLKAAGVKDAKVLEREVHNSNGRATLDFRLQFTAAKPAPGVHNWFIHGVADGDLLVLLQSVSVAAPADPKPESTARAFQKRLVAGLRLP